ncbi:hypothetical protein [Streptomyces lydicus]|uniref:hypothetical protein n=1 Tax=Streptomyces lydicus TaxID=47763 RepID=UPI001010280F|nr:hypothetical protein [Streptomyces lydicus]MCZ1012359.1 hypothetical protein [Streptomyces lydicus]
MSMNQTTETPAERRYREGMELNNVQARAEERAAEHLREAAGALQMRFAWCWDHGALHHFPTREDPWCTARWSWLEGNSETDALADKEVRHGDAKFLHQLPDAEQLKLITRQDSP